MTDELYLRYCGVSLYRGVKNAIAPLIGLCTAKSEDRALSCAAEVFCAVAAAGKTTTGEWISSLVKTDDNPFSRAVATGKSVPEHIKTQVEAELALFKKLSEISPEDIFTEKLSGISPAFKSGGFELTYGKLVDFYGKNGCGALCLADAFTYTKDGLKPITENAARLSELKSYDDEKAAVVKNTEDFINGLPAFNTLLYGDRGTGKSTTVRALGAEYGGRLKLIELNSGDLELLPELTAKLAGLKQKYIVFIDDLTFDESDGRADGFKAALEGSLDACGASNMLIYCTSNRRHLFKETDKDEFRHRTDEVQAEMALFDRFGLVVTYIDPGKDEFLSILKSILTERGIKWRAEYGEAAELAALKRGGRTPRTAKQIADRIEADSKR